MFLANLNFISAIIRKIHASHRKLGAVVPPFTRPCFCHHKNHIASAEHLTGSEPAKPGLYGGLLLHDLDRVMVLRVNYKRIKVLPFLLQNGELRIIDWADYRIPRDCLEALNSNNLPIVVRVFPLLEFDVEHLDCS